MQNGNYVVEKVVFVEASGSPDISLLQIGFKGYSEHLAYIWGNYNEILHFIDKEVVVDFREEIIKGQEADVINNMSIITQVSTLDREENIKLYSDETFEIGSNVIFRNIELGDTVDRAIVYCQSWLFESSEKATWIKLTILDKLRNVGYLRIFSPDRNVIDFAGKYIRCSMRNSKYGFVTQDIDVQDDIKIDSNPTIALAKNLLYQVIKKDQMLEETIRQYDLITKMEEYSLEEGQEVGMSLVKTAIEIALIQETKNLTKDLSLKLLIRLAFASKCYMATHKETSTMSKEMQSFLNIASSPLARDRRILICLDSKSPINLAEKEYYKHISSSAQVVVDLKGPNNLTLFNDKIFGGGEY